MTARKIDLSAEFELIGQAEQCLDVVANYLDTARGHEVAQDGLAALAQLRQRLLPRARMTADQKAARRRLRRDDYGE